MDYYLNRLVEDLKYKIILSADYWDLMLTLLWRQRVNRVHSVYPSKEG